MGIISMKEENIIKSSNDINIFYKKDIPNNPKGIVIIVHGFAEHLGRYDYFVDKLNQNGFGCYRFDNRGHGKSGGKSLDLEDYIDFEKDADLVVQKAKTEFPNLPIFMFGHSMGGFITALYGEKFKDRLNGQILSGAATDEPLQSTAILKWIINIGNKIFPKLRVKNDLSSLISRDSAVIDDYRKDPLIHDKATVRFFKQFIVEGITYLKNHAKEYNYDCLILHGKDDKIISYKSSENFYNSISSKDKKIIIYDNLYHEILNESDRDTVINDVITWLKSKDCVYSNESV